MLPAAAGDSRRGVILWAPGFAFTMIAFLPGAIGGVERAVLAVAASLALTAIPAILLDAIGVRLETSSFVITACVLTSLSALLALLRLPSLADAPLLPAGRRQPLIPIALVIVGTASPLGALLAARLTPQPAGIRGSSALAATSTAPRSVRAEVISAELETTKYRLTISTTLDRWS